MEPSSFAAPIVCSFSIPRKPKLSVLTSSHLAGLLHCPNSAERLAGRCLATGCTSNPDKIMAECRSRALDPKVKMLAEEWQHVILKSICNGTCVRAVIDFEAVRDAILIENLMEFCRIALEPILIANIDVDRTIVPQIVDVLIDERGALAVHFPSTSSCTTPSFIGRSW